MELKQLQYFVVSVDMGSLSRAAEALYTTQPHISKTIKLLETELDMTLLERLPTGVAVTEPGKKVYEYARRILSSARQITEIKQETELHKLQLSSMPSRELAELFAGFFRTENGLSVKFQQGSLEQVLHQVSHHQVELGFLFVSDYQQQALRNMLRHKKLEFHPLCETELVLTVGPENPYYDRKTVSWTDLQKIRYVQAPEEGISLISHIGHLKDSLVGRKPLQIAAVVSNDHVLLELLAQTELGNIGGCLRRRVPGADRLHCIPIDEHENTIQFGYAVRCQHVLNPYEERLLHYLSGQLGTAVQ